MKERYLAPETMFLLFSAKDIITLSKEWDDSDELPDDEEEEINS